MNKKVHLLILALAFIVSLASCTLENIGYDPDDIYGGEEITVSLRIMQSPEEAETETRHQPISRPICDGEEVLLNTGHVFLVNASGNIVRHYEIVASNSGTPTNINNNVINRADLNAGVRLPNIPQSVREVVVVGNTNIPNNLRSGGIAPVREQVIGIYEQRGALNELPVNLFGSESRAATPNSVVNGVRYYSIDVLVSPTVARFEITDIIGGGAIQSFRVEGIFIDGFYTESIVSGLTHSNRFNRPAFDGTNTLHPSLFSWNAAGLGVGAAVPGGGHRVWSGVPIPPCTSGCQAPAHRVWGYQLFARAGGASPVVPPTIVIRLGNVVVNYGAGNVTYGTRYITINSFFLEDNSQLQGINAGNIYRIPAGGLVFTEDDFTPDPNERPISVTLTVTLAEWNRKEVSQPQPIRQPNPLPRDICPGAAINVLLAEASGPPASEITYRWEQSSDGGVTITPIVGATTHNLTIAAGNHNFVGVSVRRVAVWNGVEVPTNWALLSFPPRSYDFPPYVEINGVRWATKNVGTAGTFVAHPADPGGMFTLVNAVTACPEGWRLPTNQELVNLVNARSFGSMGGGADENLVLYDDGFVNRGEWVYAVVSGLFPCQAGVLYGPAPTAQQVADGVITQVFFPAASTRNVAGLLSPPNTGAYWSGSVSDGTARSLRFGYTYGSSVVNTSGVAQFSVRCVYDPIRVQQPNPAPQEICPNLAFEVSLGVATGADGFTYRWERSVDRNAPFTTVATTQNLAVTTADAHSFVNTYVRRVAIWSGGEIVSEWARLSQPERTYDFPDRVTIGGVVWATRNLDAPGRFVAHPADPGMLYQFHRGDVGHSSFDPRRIWSRGATGWNPTTPAWNSNSETGTGHWRQGPCPAGWRLPTADEWISLVNHTSTVGTGTLANNGTAVTRGQWVGINDDSRYPCQSGIIYGNPANINAHIFLPAAGRRSQTGALSDVYTHGLYWTGNAVSADIPTGTRATLVEFWSANISSNIVGQTSMISGYRSLGAFVRCVYALYLEVDPGFHLFFREGGTQRFNVSTNYAGNWNIAWVGASPFDLINVNVSNNTFDVRASGNDGGSRSGVLRVTVANGTLYQYVVVVQMPGGNIEISTISEHFFVGAFWRNNQQGERLIRGYSADGSNVSETRWRAVAMDDWVKLDMENSADPGVFGPTPACMTTIANDRRYRLPTTASGMVSGSGEIRFRIGLRSYNTAATNPRFPEPRWSQVVILYGNNYQNTHIIWIRQGEQAHYVFRPTCPGNHRNPNNVGRWSPFNLTHPTIRDTGAATAVFQTRATNASDHFVRYPSQAGVFTQWATEDPNARRAWSPIGAVDSGTWGTPASGAWDNAHETCPIGYRRPGDLTNLSTNVAANIQYCMFRQSLWHVNDRSRSNSVFGFYADGFFDRRPINTIQVEQVASRSSVAWTTTDIAVRGRLFFNPTRGYHLFMPAAGVRNTSGEFVIPGNLTGNSGSFWNMAISGGNANSFQISPILADGPATPRAWARSIRCVRD